MEKEFINYEEALALKELGFDEPCLALYVSLVDVTGEFELIKIEKQTNKLVCAPLYQQAFRWFRERYGLYCYIEGAYPWLRYYINSEDDRYEGFKHLEFKKAELECLKKLIEIVKNDNKAN